VRSVGKFAFSLVVLTTIFYLIDAHDIFDTMSSIDPATVLVAVGFALSAQMFSAMRLNRLALLQGISLPYISVLVIGLSAVFYGLVVPGGSVAAFAARFIQLSREARVESVAVTLIMDRIVATVFLIAIGVIAVAFDQAEPDWAVPITVGAVLTAGMLVTGRLVFLRMGGSIRNALNRGRPNRIAEIAGRIRNAFLRYSATGAGQILIIVTVTCLAHLSGCLLYLTVAKSLGLNITLLSMCWIRSGMILITMIPISLAGLGLREVAAIALLAPLGVGEAQAVGFSIMVFLVTPLAVGLIGGVAEIFRVAR
jgi:uncharacterized protein (TIRG00374 family)